MQLKITNLNKEYKGGKKALSNFSLELENGILGLLGPNGAGKSTLMRILATITLPSSGQITWNGTDIVKNPNALRKVLGYLPQDFGVYPQLTAYEFLEYMAAVKGLKGSALKTRIHSLLEEVNLLHVRNKAISSFSGGMRQRIGIAQVLLNDPQLIIMDEPTVGLDPEERVRFRNLLSHLSGDRIIILSSHIVSDIETLASNIAIVNNGVLLKHDYPYEILQMAEGKVYEADVKQEELESFSKVYRVIHAMRQKTGWKVRFINDSFLPAHPTQEQTKASLEDVYLSLVSENSKTPVHA